MHEALAAQGVRFYALNVPAFGENAQTIAAFAEQAGLTYPVLSHHGTQSLIRFEGTNSFPYPRDVVVDQHGRIVYASRDYDGQHIQAVIDDLLADPPAPPTP